MERVEGLDEVNTKRGDLARRGLRLNPREISR